MKNTDVNLSGKLFKKSRGFFPAGFLALALLIPAGCSTETALQKLLGTSAESPVFLGSRALENGELEFRFSVPVAVKSAYFDPPAEIELSGEGETIRFRLTGSYEPGQLVNMDMLVADKRGNTLNVLIPFRTRNNRLPALLLNEIRLNYSKPKVEYVELKTAGAGNLGALRLFAAYNGGKLPVFEFPPVEVSANEYIVLHMRDLADEAGHKNETGRNLAESGGTEASSSARDFWAPGAVKLLQNTDVIYLCDQDDRVLDAIVLRGTSKSNANVTQAAAMLFEQDAWQSGDEPLESYAFDSTGHTATRTVNRRPGNDTNSAADWFIGATSTATPGAANTAKKYSP
ncbi:MAG: hypothetical protein LBJ31_10775 [Treponema sp.]|nr:hypothetical protein [Treponema sp.]